MWYKTIFCLFKTIKGEYVLLLYCKKIEHKSLGWGQSTHLKRILDIVNLFGSVNVWKCEKQLL